MQLKGTVKSSLFLCLRVTLKNAVAAVLTYAFRFCKANL